MYKNCSVFRWIQFYKTDVFNVCLLKFSVLFKIKIPETNVKQIEWNGMTGETHIIILLLILKHEIVSFNLKHWKYNDNNRRKEENSSCCFQIPVLNAILYIKS